MKILGIDPGTTACGWGMIDYDNKTRKASLIEYGIVNSGKEVLVGDRLNKIYAEISRLVESLKPDALGIEELFFFKNAKTVISVSQARGVVIAASRAKRVPIYEYTPLQVKQAITGYGGADKQQIQKMVQVLLQLKDIPKPDDAADALAVAITCAHSQQSQIVHE